MILSLRHGNQPATENGDPIDFPGYSSGHFYKKFGITFMKVDNLNEIFLGSWIVKPLVPILSSLIAIFGVPLATAVFFRKFSCWKLLFVIDTILMIFFLVSFFRTSIDGPGYYPFYWALGDNPIITNNEFYESGEESVLFKSKFDPPPAGIISNDLQLTWARTQKRPARSIVAKSARRIVIRPDHYCKYSETWIGKRNFKFFILFNLYGSLFVGLITLVGVFVIYGDFKSGNWGLFNFTFLFHVAGEITAFEFTGLCFSFFVASIMSVCRGTTDWERTNKLPVIKFSKGSLKANIEDVMGPMSKFYLYLSPFYSPWSNIPNDDLIAGYNNYYE
ncbi:DHHC zinc finger domain containing protein [Tritrichomonas foetus]|uniref:Palmitoyltransferase n=1 Tax=Tritrichomonas foetus TaxID=1144522 RepID=A0A1J4JR80_9EUKA|nr:DHHC zinc finger domain containing protein [Tritrichomonas foetus]|eukprot:OHT00020.1 DHHC zinc finger domain containing protein [Tritrichomonas foetus]